VERPKASGGGKRKTGFHHGAHRERGENEKRQKRMNHEEHEGRIWKSNKRL
jgi:hypothetical protein